MITQLSKKPFEYHISSNHICVYDRITLELNNDSLGGIVLVQAVTDGKQGIKFAALCTQ